MTRSILINALAFLAATGCTPDVYNEYDIDVFVESPEDTATDTDTGTDEPSVVTYHVPDESLQVHETSTRLEFVGAEHFRYASEVGPDLDCMVVTLSVPAEASQGVLIEFVEFGAIASDHDSTDWFHGLRSVGTGSNVRVLGELQLFRDADTVAGTELYYEANLNNSGPAQFWDLVLNPEWGEHVLSVRTLYFTPIGADVNIGFCMGWSPSPAWHEPYDVYGDPNAAEYMAAVLGRVLWTPADDQDFQSSAIHGTGTPFSSAWIDAMNGE